MAMTRDPHAAHDPYLVAQLAADDLAGPERAAAERLVARCARCRELLSDLTGIMAATADLPAPARTRDFRLTEADAARLRSPWRRWFGPFARPRFAFAQPLGAALATIGLAGLLLGILPNLAVTTTAPVTAPAPVAGGNHPTAGSTEPSNRKAAPSPAASAAFAQGAPSGQPEIAASAVPTAEPTPPPTAATTAEPAGITSVTAATAAPAVDIGPAATASDGSAAAGAAPATAEAPAIVAPLASPASGGTADHAPSASEDAGGTSPAQVPAGSPAAPGGSAAAPNDSSAAPTSSSEARLAASAPVATSERGMTTGINPGRSPAPTAVAEVPAAPSNSPVNGLLAASAAAFVIGLVLLGVRRVAVRTARRS